MTTINRTIETEHDKKLAVNLIEARSIPFTLSLTDGKHRSTAQNKLQRMWMNEISEQRGDMTPEEARGYCKLTIGVPILRAENEAFREGYDRVVKPLPYDQKIAIMMEPLDLPVTRIMTTKQKSEYLDGIIRHFGEQGIVLTMPEDMRIPNNEASGAPPPQSPDDGESAPPLSAPLEPVAQTPSQATGSDIPKRNYEGDDLKLLREFGEKGLREARRSPVKSPAALQFIDAMYPQYVSLLVSADAVEALGKMRSALDLVIEGERNADRIEAWFSAEFLASHAAEPTPAYQEIK